MARLTKTVNLQRKQRILLAEQGAGGKRVGTETQLSHLESSGPCADGSKGHINLGPLESAPGEKRERKTLPTDQQEGLLPPEVLSTQGEKNSLRRYQIIKCALHRA